MATFIAEVRDFQGNAKKEKVEAISQEQARAILKNRYSNIGKVSKAGFDLDLSQLGEKFTTVSVKDKAVFSRQFAAMVDAGVAMVRCLGVLSDQCANPKLKKSLLDISSDVQQGT
ncbi:MAG: type II secretion system F family protein, partial [Symploca sp. SIO2E6]|nr:type II secretion system F family protein [Symploca sp. SIO2E6]